MTAYVCMDHMALSWQEWRISRHSWRCTLCMFLNISFDFVHRWNAQLAELIEQRTGLAEFAQMNHFTVFRLSIEKFRFECYLTHIERSAPVVKFT